MLKWDMGNGGGDSGSLGLKMKAATGNNPRGELNPAAERYDPYYAPTGIELRTIFPLRECKVFLISVQQSELPFWATGRRKPGRWE